MDRWLQRLTEQISLAHDEIAIRETLQKITVQAGFDSYAYLSLQGETEKAISTYPQDWQHRYFEKSYARIDPVIRSARSEHAAFSWSNVPTKRQSKERRTFFGEAAEFGIRSGITIPVKIGFARMAMLTFASSTAEFGGAQSFSPVTAASAACHVYSRVDLVGIKPTNHTPIRLRAGELTCLRWSSEGKTMEDIATLENIRYSSVAFFLRNAKRALGAATLPQATALAKEFGLI